MRDAAPETVAPTVRRCARPLRIAFLTSYFLSPDQAGPLRSWQVARLLAERGHRVTVLTTDTHYMTGGAARANLSQLGPDEQLEVRYVRTPRNYRRIRLGRWGFLLGLTLGWSRELVRGPRYDVVLAVTPPPPVAALVAALLRGSPFVYEIRDPMTDDAVEMGALRHPLLIRAGYALEALLYRAAAAIVAVTPGIGALVVGRGVPPSKVTVVTNGYDEELFERPPIGLDPRRAHGWDQRFVAIFVGAMGHSTDLATILEAAALLRDDERFLFVFLGEGEQRAGLERQARERRLQNC
ncbi:MAG TPA: glycosyltransferase family 4 protein, partial [Dehalococcoidia bacterium]|nr:glycosyltransferase family 4 protein [Dehalococcoidia bacterium]